MKAGMDPSKVSSTISSSRERWASSLEIKEETIVFSFWITPRWANLRMTV